MPYLTERENFRQVLLRDRLRDALRRINLDPASPDGEGGQPWLDEIRLTQAVSTLERLGHPSLLENNQEATRLLIKGTQVTGPDGGKAVSVHYIDYEHPERNDFLAINQFRVDPPWATGNRGYVVPDLVLFVNGIPLVVVEAKDPDTLDPLTEAIGQLLRYSNQRLDVLETEGAERLFHYAQLLVATCFEEARLDTVGALHKYYLAWKDTYPVKTSEVSENPGGLEEGLEALSQQELLVAGALRPAHLLDLLHNFTLFDRGGGRIKKIVPRYQQFRAVHKAVEQLQQGATRAEDGEYDRRGGIIWHTQGSGKSLSMVFLIRKMRALPDLRRFKIVLITDRTKLEEQLAETAALTGEPLQIADSITDFLELLRQPGAGLVFGLADHLHEALEIYTRNDIHGALRPIADEVPKLRDRHARVVELFTGHGCDLLDTEGCVELLRDARLRARFIVTLREFLETLDFVLPRPEALPYVRDAQQLGLIRLRTTRRYRDQHLDIAGAEAKVRRLIDAYVVAQGVDPRIPPLDILDAEFEAHVGRLRSPRAQAAEMEFAARHHIRRHLQEDPVYYQKLSERLEEILQRFADNWEAQVEALRDLLRDYRQTQAEMSQEEQAVRPFLRLLVAAQEEREPTAERRRTLAAAAVGLVEEIRREIARVDFWRKPVAQERLRATLLRYLDNHDLVPFERQEALADQLLQTARANHSRLVE